MHFALSGSTQRPGALLRMLVPSAAASAFLNNTPIVAMLMPTIRATAQRCEIPPSRLLMPLSFAVILGGVVTTIGTSTNLVVSGLLQESGHAPFGLFEPLPIGLPIAVVGVLFVSLAAPFLLPDRQPPRRQLDAADRDFVVRMIGDEQGGIHREGQPVVAKLGEVKLRLGDTLLLLADDGFRERLRDRSDFLVIAALESEQGAFGGHAYVALAITSGVIVAAGNGWASILHASIAGRCC